MTGADATTRTEWWVPNSPFERMSAYRRQNPWRVIRFWGENAAIVSRHRTREAADRAAERLTLRLDFPHHVIPPLV